MRETGTQPTARNENAVETKGAFMKITALYERLSSGDEGRNGDSNSIKNQKLQLEAYAKANGFGNIKHYVDDDESGRFFDRSGYVQMMEDVESGKVGVCVMKDMTRWGRDYLQVGNAMETFRRNDVRFIAINHGIDSIHPESLEMAPFINIMSEWYAKDCSKKVKSAYHTKGMTGKPLSVPAYGYMKHPDNKDFWIVDEPAAAVVRQIFQLCLQGKGIFQIACTLTESKIPIPAHYQAMNGTGKWMKREIKDPYSWNLVTVERILQNRAYCGDVVNFKTATHIKDKRSHYTDESEWVIFENVHEPIIDRETFENAQRIFKSLKRKRADKQGSLHPLAGLLYCSDCGGKMYIFCPEKNGKSPFAQCGNYRKTYERIERHYNIDCGTSRRIIVNNILELVQDTIKGIADYAKTDKTAFEKTIKGLLTAQQTDEVKAQQKRLAACRKRYGELETLMNKIYEDNALGRLPQNRYESLLATYGQEQDELGKEIEEIQTAVERYEDGSGRAERFLKLVERYTDFEEITPAMIHEFVEKIVVHAKENQYIQSSPQKIEIHLNFIGEIALPDMEHEPTAEEIAEQERREKVREYDRRRYQERKARGYYTKQTPQLSKAQ
jgi:DNA invertase Pin-like site-specific DNA recombinase/ssDNA-binding Zn-finger/Zn-ribbon topoisomerase 1